MLFNSLNFLVFFPVVTIVYFLLPFQWRWLYLLLVSCIFYISFIPAYIIVLFITIVIDYCGGICIESAVGKRRKYFLLLSISSTVLVLAVFKYYNFFIDNVNQLAHFIGWSYSLKSLAIALPIGLSFHTFQSLSYVIEVYRGQQKAERHFGIYSLYVMYYPQLVAGPIERPQNLLHQFKRNNKFKFQNFYCGLRLIVFGFFMKLVVADRLGIYVDTVYDSFAIQNGASLALATFFFSFQIYCDFAGYSSIAIGISRVMGIRLMTNFRRPYLSKSISEFWNRWHISLSSWFRDYVYIPLGGNSVTSKPRWYLNIMITFLASGFWHGASWTFLAWGGLNGIYVIAGKLVARVHRALNSLNQIINIISVFVLINVSWIFFRSRSVPEGMIIIKKILNAKGKAFLPYDREIFIYCLLSVFLIAAIEIFYEYVYAKRRIGANYVALNNAFMLFLIVCIVLFGVFDGSQFIYFQF